MLKSLSLRQNAQRALWVAGTSLPEGMMMIPTLRVNVVSIEGKSDFNRSDCRTR